MRDSVSFVLFGGNEDPIPGPNGGQTRQVGEVGGRRAGCNGANGGGRVEVLGRCCEHLVSRWELHDVRDMAGSAGRGRRWWFILVVRCVAIDGIIRRQSLEMLGS